MNKPRLRPTVILAGLLTIGLGDASASASPAQPDILLIMPDQMRGDCMSIGRTSGGTHSDAIDRIGQARHSLSPCLLRRSPPAFRQDTRS